MHFLFVEIIFSLSSILLLMGAGLNFDPMSIFDQSVSLLESYVDSLEPTTIFSQRTVNGTSGVCLSRTQTCLILKLCNLEITVGNMNESVPAGICLGGIASANIDFSSLLPEVNISFTNYTTTVPNPITGEGCNCFACNIPCSSNPLSGCTDPPLSSTSTNFTQTTDPRKFSGSAEICAYYNPSTMCIAIVLCNINGSFLGTGVSEGNVPIICGEGNATFAFDLNFIQNTGLLNLQLSNPNITLFPTSGACECNSCSINCKSNPLIGCGSNSTSTSAPCHSFTTTSRTDTTSEKPCWSSTTRC